MKTLKNSRSKEETCDIKIVFQEVIKEIGYQL